MYKAAKDFSLGFKNYRAGATVDTSRMRQSLVDGLVSNGRIVAHESETNEVADQKTEKVTDKPYHPDNVEKDEHGWTKDDYRYFEESELERGKEDEEELPEDNRNTLTE